MFLWSKLVAITLPTIVTSGTASSLLVPYLKGQSIADWLSQLIYKKDSSRSEFNFDQLDKESNNRLAELEKWFRKLSASEAIANTWKRIEFAKIQKLFENIANAEKELIKLFEKISSSLSALLIKNKSFFDISLQKLEEEKKEQLQKNMKNNYSLLQNALSKWESSLSEITCAIEKKGAEDGECREKTGLISSIVNSAFSFASLFSSSNGSTSSSSESSQQNSNGALGGGEKAQQELEKVKEALLKEIKNLREKNMVVKLWQAQATSQEIDASLKYFYYSSLLKVLSAQQDNLQKIMKSDEEQTNKKIKDINKYSKHLTGHHKQYTSLQKQEAIFHNWKEIFNERILKNESNKKREVILVREKKK